MTLRIMRRATLVFGFAVSVTACQGVGPDDPNASANESAIGARPGAPARGEQQPPPGGEEGGAAPRGGCVEDADCDDICPVDVACTCVAGPRGGRCMPTCEDDLDCPAALVCVQGVCGQGQAGDDRQPPPDGQQPPADDQQPPPDGRQPPPDGQQPPPDGRQPPPDGQQPPPDGRQPPPDGRQPPQEPAPAEEPAPPA
ncbi:MAG: hypothetical protein KC620_14875, partial [Myxococcales bacterium]|nr:hypothetical protein [Myxococcales bacterium]